MSNRVCAVAGIGPGIGLAVARRFGKEGFTIAMMARRPQALAEYGAELHRDGVEAAPFPMDATDFASVRTAFAQMQGQIGPADVLIYNAAVLHQGRPSELSPERLVADFRVNVAAALCCAQQVLPHMRDRRRGTILLTGGGFALQPAPQVASLAAGKAALRNLAESLAADLLPDGIHVATVTVCGIVKPGTHFDPERIAEAYWTLHTQETGQFQHELMYR